MPRRAILLFAKLPVPGHVKTRLAAAIGAEAAAAAYRQLVAAVCRTLSVDCERVVMFDPPERGPEMEAWLAPLLPSARFLPQAAGDLGARLECAFAETFADGAEEVAVVGSDCIEIDAEIFSAAWRALATHDAALGPSEDGGYYLLALRRPCARLFENIAWSTSAVAAQTLERARECGLRVALLPMRRDVDTEADWRRVASSIQHPAS